MQSKLQLYSKLADHTAARITGSFQQWTSFLTTAARLYKYPYHEQLMIYAQRPEATACAGYELWNKQMGRYIRRDSKGIALIDTSGDSPKLKYVFDVADTSGRENSRRLFLWEYRPEEHEAAVTDALEQRFNIPSISGLDYQLKQISYDLASDFWERNKPTRKTNILRDAATGSITAFAHYEMEALSFDLYKGRIHFQTSAFSFEQDLFMP